MEKINNKKCVHIIRRGITTCTSFGKNCIITWGKKGLGIYVCRYMYKYNTYVHMSCSPVGPNRIVLIQDTRDAKRLSSARLIPLAF